MQRKSMNWFLGNCNVCPKWVAAKSVGTTIVTLSIALFTGKILGNKSVVVVVGDGGKYIIYKCLKLN